MHIIESSHQFPNVISGQTRAERQSFQSRVERIFEALSHVSQLEMNTGKEEKAKQLLQFIAKMTGQQLEIGDHVKLFVDDHPEPKSYSAAKVARHKALQPRRYKQDSGFVTTGQDVNGFIAKNGVVQPSHKFDRLGRELSDQELENVFDDLINVYCFPHDGQVRVLWDLSTHVINGREYNFGDVIEVISAPVDRELLWKYLLEARQNGLLYKSNMHFAALECVVENDKILSVSVLSREMQLRGYTLGHMRRAPYQSMLEDITTSVVTNVPVMLE